MYGVAGEHGPVALGNTSRLPFLPGVSDSVSAAGLLNHLPDPYLGSVEFGRVTQPGGVLVLFHPLGRSTRAARRGHDLANGAAGLDGLALDVIQASTWSGLLFIRNWPESATRLTMGQWA
jgi:hypothetical protein